MSLFRSRRTPQKPELIRTVSYPYQQHRRLERRAPVKRTSSNHLLAALILIPLMGAVVFNIFKADGGGSSAEAESAITAPVPEPVKSLEYTDMSARINAVIAANPGMDIGVATVDIKTGDTKTYGVENVFVAASTAKLLTAIAFLHDVEQGQHKLSETIGGRSAQSTLEALIVDSDNQAWNDLNNVAMSHAEMAEYAETIGFTNYDPDRNTTTATSLAILLSNLHQRRLLNEEHTSLLLSFMARAKEVEYINSTVPAGVKVYHKPGYLIDRVHDAAIIDNQERPYSLVIFTKSRTAGTYNATAGAEVFKMVAQATYDTFLK